MLDLGSGDGALACAMGKWRNVVLGLDISSRAVEEALERSAERHVSEWIGFRQGNAVSIGLDDASFDIGVSYPLIEHLHPTQLGLI